MWWASATLNSAHAFGFTALTASTASVGTLSFSIRASISTTAPLSVTTTVNSRSSPTRPSNS
jgi:hypothetical protein